MTAPQRAYESTNRRYIYEPNTGRERQRVKRCGDCRAVLAEDWSCPECQSASLEVAE